jgi:hypothetical protein
VFLLWAAATRVNAGSDTIERFRNAGEHSAVPAAFAGGSFSLPVERLAHDERINRLLNGWRQRGGRGLIFTRPGSAMIHCRHGLQAPTPTLTTGESGNGAFVA